MRVQSYWLTIIENRPTDVTDMFNHIFDIQSNLGYRTILFSTKSVFDQKV